MALIPSRTKFRKSHRGSRAGNASRGTKVDFGEYGLQSLGRAWITSQQIEACRVAINRALKRKGKVWIRIFPHKPITKRPPETRMGKGKGSTDYWAAKVKPGRIMFEIDGVNDEIAREALRLGAMKLPVTTRIVAKEDW